MPKFGSMIVPHGCFELLGLTEERMVADDILSDRATA